MQWLSIVLMILKLLKQAKEAESKREFVSAAEAANSPFAANGAILQWFWDHREEIIALIVAFFEKSPTIFRASPIPGESAAITSDDSQVSEVLALVEELKS